MYIELVVVVSYLDVYVWPGNTFVNSNVIAVVPGCGSHDKTRKRSEQYWIPVSIDFRRGQWFSLPPVAAAGRVLLSSLVQYSSIYSLDVLATGSVTILSLMAIDSRFCSSMATEGWVIIVGYCVCQPPPKTSAP
jgi:hypothetical protein